MELDFGPTPPLGMDIAVNTAPRDAFATGSHTLPLSGATTMSRSSSTTSSISSSFRHHPYSTLRPTSASGSSRSGTEDSESAGEGDSLPEVAAMDLDDGRPDDLPSFSLSASPAPDPAPRGRAPAKPKVKASHARKTSPDHIKRPPNAFIMFRSHCCNPAESGEALDAPGTPSAVQLAGLGITDHRHISRIASILWKALSPPDKGYWERRAKERKEEHLLQHPGYKYKPVFRNKDDIRRRKKAFADEMETEKRGCEEVARALMCAPEHLADQTNQAAVAHAARDASESAESSGGGGSSAERDWRDEEFHLNQSRVTNPPPSVWTIDQVKPLAAALSTAPLEASPKRKRTRPSTASSRRRQASDEYPIHSLAQPSQFLGDSYAHHQQQQPPPQDFRPHSAPAGEYAPFGFANDERRRGGYVRATSYNHLSANGDGGDGAYSNGLDPDPAHSLDAPYYGQQHQRAVSAQPYSSQSQHQPLYPAPPSSRRAAPTPIIPHNPSFLYYHPQQAGDTHHASFESSIAEAQLSLRALAMAHMQAYTLDAEPVERHRSPSQEVVLSPTSTTFTYDGAIESVPSAPEQDDAPNFTLAGMKRRGTLGRTALGGDLMLISPTTAHFSTGKRFSLGRWEVRKVSVDGQVAPSAEQRGPHPLSRSPRGSFSFDGAFMQSAQDEDDETVQRERGGYAPSPEYHARPDTASSDYSSSSSHEADAREFGGPTDYWCRGSDAKDDDRPFHVGPSDFFLPPAPPLSTRPFEFSRASSDLGQTSLFNYPSFGNAGYSTQRPSIDALLAGTDAYAPYLSVGPSQEWLENRVGRDSDAAIKWNPRRESVVPEDIEEEQDDEIRISALSTTREQALKVLEHSMRVQDSAEDEGCRYIYLSKELSADTSLIEQILHAGFGVTYDHSGAAEAPAVDYDPQTARQETFGASPTSITSPPPSFASF